MDYIVKASDLYARAKEIINSGMDYVEISLAESSGELPAAVCFSAATAGQLDGWEDFDEIEVTDPWDSKA